MELCAQEERLPQARSGATRFSGAEEKVGFYENHRRACGGVVVCMQSKPVRASSVLA